MTSDFFELVLNGTPEQVEIALQQGASVDERSEQGWTPLLSAACRNQNPEVVTVLLHAGAKVDERSELETTPLMCAAGWNPNPEVVLALLKAGADVADKDKFGCTPLMYAAHYNPNPEIIAMLVEAGAQVNDRDNDGQTPLIKVAQYSCNPAVTAELLKAGAGVNERDNHGLTAILYVGVFPISCYEVASLLSEAGAEYTVVSKTNEERLARELYHELSSKFADDSQNTVVEISPSPIDIVVLLYENRVCTLTRGMRSCVVTCRVHGVYQYHIRFIEQELIKEQGRTTSNDDVLLAVDAWLSGRQVGELYNTFDFIQPAKKRLLFIEESIFASLPGLSTIITANLVHNSFLMLTSGDRSSRLYVVVGEYLSISGIADFYVDESSIFRFALSPYTQASLPTIVKRWVADNAMPSAIVTEFPWIEMSPLAHYYEQGRFIEGEFMRSWDQCENNCRDVGKRYPQFKLIAEFINILRKAGYDHCFRAGMSLCEFIVSRSKQHGLRPGQPWVKFYVDKNVMKVYVDGQRRLSYKKAELTPEIEIILQELTQKEID